MLVPNSIMDIAVVTGVAPTEVAYVWSGEIGDRGSCVIDTAYDVHKGPPVEDRGAPSGGRAFTCLRILVHGGEERTNLDRNTII